MSPVRRYEIGPEMGCGPASVTYQGIDSATQRAVTVVTVDLNRFSFLAGAGAHEQLKEALQAASALSHSNIVELYEVIRQDDALHIVTEFVAGIEKSAVDEALEGLRQIGQALDYAHRKGVVHGAVRPENILLGKDATKIAGFGFARMLTRERNEYWSPEQIEGREIDGRSDQFSMAVIARDYLGRSQQPSETVEKILARALAVKPEDRFPSVSDFFGALSIAVGESQHLAPVTKILEPVMRERATAPQSSVPGKQLALVVIFCFLVAAAIMFTVRMNSGTAIPVQVIETRSAPTSAPPTETQSAAEKQPASPVERAPSHVEPRPVVPHRERPVSDGGIAVNRTADVDIVSDPSGARIAVDGRSDATCHAPCTMTLPVGRHTLTAQLAGYATAQRIFNAPEASNVYIQLAQSYGLLVLTANLPNTTILIDGKVSGGTPATLRVSAGMHRVTLLNGRLRHDEVVSVEPDSMQSRDVRW